MNTTNQQFRYPGLGSFTTAQRDLFFGRKRETRELFNLLSVEKTVVLFSKSGYGKTSLLNAGVIPLLAEAGILPIPIRFGNDSLLPEQHFSAQFDAAFRRFDGKNEREAIDNSASETVWEQVKNAEFRMLSEAKSRTAGRNAEFHHSTNSPIQPIPLLIFDQFEELFTLYPQPERRARFIAELADLIQERLPAVVRERLFDDLDAGKLTASDLAEAEKAPPVKLIFSIRSDMLHFLDELSEQIPFILRSRYQLFGLGLEQAREAIEAPARLPRGDRFLSQPFGFLPVALDEIVGVLTKNREVESFQLQAVCQALEEKIIDGQRAKFDRAALLPTDENGLPLIDPDFYGGPEGIGDILDKSYQRRLDSLPDDERTTAARLLEDALVNENGRRRSVDVADLMARAGVTTALLDRLETQRLVRKEPRLDSFYYEISHDTLLAPIVRSRKTREEAEERERLRVENERQLAEQRKINIARRRNAILLAGAVGLLLFAIYSNFQAGVARADANKKGELATEMTQKAAENEAIAKTKADEAAAKTIEAEANFKKAEAALAAVSVEKRATAEQKKIARTNFEQAKEALAAAQEAETAAFFATRKADDAKYEARINLEQLKMAEAELQVSKAEFAKRLVAEADKSIYKLKYDEAFEVAKQAANLFENRPEVARVLLEIAFFHTESGHPDRAAEPLELAGRLLPKNAADLQTDWGGHKMIFENRYFPEMVALPGGKYWMGCDSTIEECENESELPRHEVNIRPFKMAKTETTVWQFNLFLAAEGKDIFDKDSIGQLVWGWEGDNPMINVSWNDAQEYARWLSGKKGFATTNGYRLPSESEWEYAARGGERFIYAGSNDMGEVGWFNKNSGSRTRPVKGKKANGFGLFDLSGNVWEWCEDRLNRNYVNAPTDGLAWVSGDNSSRLLRGGSWDYDYGNCRSASRGNYGESNRYDSIGFRVAQGN